MPDTNEKVPVAVVIPCFRCKDTVERAIDSVMRQTMLPQEIILVDDCSQDGTEQMLQKMVAGYPKGEIKVLSLNRNSGPGSARNAGWAATSCPYIAFLDADDTWHPQKLELQYGWMCTHPQVDLTGHGTARINAVGGLSLNGDLQASPVSGRRLLLSNQFPTRSVMVRSTVPFRFCPGKRYSEDYLLWLEIVLSGYSAWRLDATLAFSYKPDFGGAGLSANIWSHEKGELDTYVQLLHKRLISRGIYLLVIIFSLMKFMRRLLVSAIIRHPN